MSRKKIPAVKSKKSPFVGTWVDVNPYFSEVEFTIAKRAKGMVVKAWDPDDGEAAIISDVSFTSSMLSFVARWPGRTTINRFEVVSPGKLRMTFTYTEATILVRPSKRPAEFRKRYGRRLAKSELAPKRSK